MDNADRQFILSRFSIFSRYLFESMRGSEFIWNHHHETICNTLERVLLGLTNRLIINIPPRFTKTELAVKMFTAYSMGLYPDSEFIHTSYTSRLAANNSYTIRAMMQHEAYKELYPDVSLLNDSRARDHWKTAQGGVFYAAGSDGTITGFGAGKVGRGGADGFGGALIIDDPHKAKEAKRSPASREAVKDFYKGTVETRLNDQRTPIIVIMQRLHEDDLTGWLLSGGSGEKFEHLNMPAINTDGSALWPAKMSLRELKRFEQSKPFEYASQYMQRPTPIGGGMFKTGWFNSRYTIAPNFLFIVQSWDTAQKDNVLRNDPSVCTTWGIAQNGFYLLDVYKKHMQYPELLQKMKDLAAKWNPTNILIEDKSSGISAIQDLKSSTRLPVIAIEPCGSKIDRAESVTGYYKAGRVLLPESAIWIADYTSEHELFPFATHDDQVDSSSQFLTYINSMRGRDYAAV